MWAPVLASPDGLICGPPGSLLGCWLWQQCANDWMSTQAPHGHSLIIAVAAMGLAAQSPILQVVHAEDCQQWWWWQVGQTFRSWEDCPDASSGRQGEAIPQAPDSMLGFQQQVFWICC